jgi:hypothetical protein
MPAPEPGHGAAWLKAAASPWFDPQDPPAPPQSRRNTMPAGLTAERILTIQQATQRPPDTLPTSNPHRPNRPNRRA